MTESELKDKLAAAQERIKILEDASIPALAVLDSIRLGEVPEKEREVLRAALAPRAEKPELVCTKCYSHTIDLGECPHDMAEKPAGEGE